MPGVHIWVEGTAAAACKVSSFVEAEADGRLCCRAGAACGFGQPAREHARDPWCRSQVRTAPEGAALGASAAPKAPLASIAA